MRPQVDMVLKGFFGTLLLQVIPSMSAGYWTDALSVMGLALHMAAQECERAADVRATDNAEMRSLLAEAADKVSDAALATRLHEGARHYETSLRISDLDQSNDVLKALLTDLHAYLKEQTGARAAELERKILTHLKLSAERRLIVHPLAAYAVPTVQGAA